MHRSIKAALIFELQRDFSKEMFMPVLQCRYLCIIHCIYTTERETVNYSLVSQQEIERCEHYDVD